MKTIYLFTYGSYLRLVRAHTTHDIVFLENQTIEDIDKVEKLESSSFDGIVHLDGVPHTSVHDVVGLYDHGDVIIMD